MAKIRLKNVQTAQGMVEFALVLPILLLLILGIFAFGHLFFTYSSVVSASREAARWGAAVGGPSGENPRWMDCDNIRATALRIGAFAGVNMTDIDPDDDKDTGIDVTYDKGPGTATIGECPYGSVGPEDVGMGDRILVRVRIMYRPIVPVINFPSFPMEATTFRTILRSVPVGEVPTAKDPCETTTLTELNPIPEPSYVGQPVVYSVDVSRAVYDPTQEDPTGNVQVIDTLSGTNICSGTLVNGNLQCPAIPYWKAGSYNIKAMYLPSGSCFTTSQDVKDHVVKPATTQVVIKVDPSHLMVKQNIYVTLTVQHRLPDGSLGTGIPTGSIVLTLEGRAPMTLDLPTDTNVVSTSLLIMNPGPYDLKAEYSGDGNYAPSVNHYALNLYEGTATLGAPATDTPVPGLPTKTPVPAYCPHLEPSNYDIFQVGSAIQMPIFNPNMQGASNTSVKSVEITWPSDPTAQLQEIRFGAAVDSCIADGGSGSRNCLYQNPTGLDPTHQTVSSGSSGWDNNFAGINKNVTKFMRLVFNHSMPQGPYSFKITFTNNCIIEFDSTKTTQ